jgi:hypothetical protein
VKKKDGEAAPKKPEPAPKRPRRLLEDEVTFYEREPGWGEPGNGISV